jgi:uncharacterized protein
MECPYHDSSYWQALPTAGRAFLGWFSANRVDRRHGFDYAKTVIATLTIELSIEHAHSLKDKRQVVRSLKDRLRSSFNVSVAELDPSNLWNQATIGVVAISHSRDYLDGLMKNVERAATRIANNQGAEITDSFVEFL